MIIIPCMVRVWNLKLSYHTHLLQLEKLQMHLYYLYCTNKKINIRFCQLSANHSEVNLSVISLHVKVT